MRRGFRGGQAAVEYLIAFCALLAAVWTAAGLLRSTRNAVARTERLVGADSP